MQGLCSYRGRRLITNDVQENILQVGVVFCDQVRHPPFDFQLALVYDRDTITDSFDLTQFMRGKENRFTGLFETLDDLPYFHTPNGVQPACWFVEDQQIRV